MLLLFSVRIAEKGHLFHSVYCACLSRTFIIFGVCPSFPFGFDGEMWDLIVLIHGHCLSIYLVILVGWDWT